MPNTIIYSGADATQAMTIDATSKAARATLYDSSGRQVTTGNLITYYASGSFTPGATPNDLVTITGSGTKTIRVVSMQIATTNTTANSIQLLLTKRSALDTGGAFVAATVAAATAGPRDDNDVAFTANVGHWTASPGTLGTSVGVLNTLRVAVPVPVGTSFDVVTKGSETGAAVEMLPDIPESPVSALRKQITLRGAAEQLAITYSLLADKLTAQLHSYEVAWTEE